MCVGLFLCCDSILLYKIENTFRNIFRRGEGIMAAELKPIDVICQPSRDGKITPMKIRVIDEDGEYQEYKIKGYNIIMRNNIGLNKKRILAARYATRPFSSAKAAEAGRHMHYSILYNLIPDIYHLLKVLYLIFPNSHFIRLVIYAGI